MTGVYFRNDLARPLIVKRQFVIMTYRQKLHKKVSSYQKVQSVIDISEFAVMPMRLFADELTCTFSQEPLDGGF